MVTGPPFPSFLIQPIFRANLPQLSSLTKLFWLLPHYHKTPSLPLSLLLLTDPSQISYCTHLTWHALQFFLISPYYYSPVSLPFLIHEKQAQSGQNSVTHLYACLACLPGSSLLFLFNCYLVLFLSCSNSVIWNKTLYFKAIWDCCFSPRFLQRGPVGYVKDKLSESLADFPSEHSSGLSGLSY